MTHTPGPWTLHLARSGPRIVADTSSKQPAGTIICSGLGGNRGNAHLIAAAPELLEALIKIMSLERTQGVTDDEWDNAWEQAEAAIAKAEGK